MLVSSLKEHRNRVYTIVLRKDNTQAVSCSGDGSCIVWDIINCVRLIAVNEKNHFKEIALHPMEYHMLTTGNDKRITYWGVFDGQPIRYLDASYNGGINSV